MWRVDGAAASRLRALRGTKAEWRREDPYVVYWLDLVDVSPLWESQATVPRFGPDLEDGP